MSVLNRQSKCNGYLYNKKTTGINIAQTLKGLILWLVKLFNNLPQYLTQKI